MFRLPLFGRSAPLLVGCFVPFTMSVFATGSYASMAQSGLNLRAIKFSSPVTMMRLSRLWVEFPVVQTFSPKHILFTGTEPSSPFRLWAYIRASLCSVALAVPAVIRAIVCGDSARALASVTVTYVSLEPPLAVRMAVHI